MQSASGSTASQFQKPVAVWLWHFVDFMDLVVGRFSIKLCHRILLTGPAHKLVHNMSQTVSRPNRTQDFLRKSGKYGRSYLGFLSFCQFGFIER